MISITKKMSEFEIKPIADLNNNIPTKATPSKQQQVKPNQQQQQQQQQQQAKRKPDLIANGIENGHTALKNGREAVMGLPNEKALLELMDRTGYPISQYNGQRKYGPPPSSNGALDTRGSEVFVGKLPRDCFEDELIPIFEKAGRIYEFRLMMDYNGQNRGFAFVLYFTKRDAQKCVRTINNYEIRKGRLLGVCLSIDNHRLFVGGIPKKVKKDEIYEEISKVTDNVVKVIVYPSATDKTKNRGFAFIEYGNHRAAAMARKKLMNGKIQLWGHPIAVDWAEPEQEVDEEIMDQVRVLYVRNLQLSTTEETIENLFKSFAEVERVKKIKDYCFVHFVTREGARHALDKIQGKSIDGTEVEVTLAKPVDKEQYRQQRAVAKLMQMANQYPQFPVLPQELPTFNGMPPSFNQMPGLMYPPSLLPGAQVGVRPIARGRGRTAAGSRSAGGRAYVLNGFLPSLHPILQASIGSPGNVHGNMQEHLYDILPGMDLSPTNPITLKPQSNRSPLQVLEEICQKHQWGAPIYTLHSTVTSDGQLFLYKVTIPPLGNTYQPPKLCRNLDEAKLFAAEYTLSQIGSDTGSPQLSPAPFRVPSAAMNGRNGGEGTSSFPGYVPITTQTPVVSGVVAKVSWPNGVPPPPVTYFEYPDPQDYTQYHQY